MKNEKKIIFIWFFQKNMEKCRKKRKMMKMGRYWWKRSKLMKNEKRNIFSHFSEKDGKMSNKDENDENGSDIDEKGENW